MKNQKGFGVLEGLLILIIAAILGYSGWYIWHANNKSNETLSNADKANSSVQISKKSVAKDPTADWLTYSNKEGKFSLKYPKDWTVKSDNSAITSPSGTELTVFVQTEGGFGFCEGDSCSVLEYKSVEDIGQRATYGSDDGSGVKYNQVPLNLVTLTQTGNGKVTYYIGLNDDTKAKDEINKPQSNSGAGFGSFLFTSGNGSNGFPLVALYSSSTSASFLTNSDANIIKDILRSYKSE